MVSCRIFIESVEEGMHTQMQRKMSLTRQIAAQNFAEQNSFFCPQVMILIKPCFMLCSAVLM